jgi:hypothetical protein
MSLALQSTPLPPELGIPVSDWQRTPTSVRDEFLSLLKRVDALEARLNRDSSTSSRPPSTDSAAKKREPHSSGFSGSEIQGRTDSLPTSGFAG